MKKFVFIIAGLLFLAFASAPAMAGHDAAKCHPIAQAKVDVASWDKGNTAVWEYVKEGYKFDALMAWAKARVAVPASVDGILVSYITNAETGEKLVLWAISPNGECVEMSTFQKMTPNEFEAIAGKVA